ncbi:MAG: succinate dehydrogenase, hydrophobic membrane anchor protein [Wigglesworthia glossinidia]|nr:succinate dehydrogenase, hydrophobic membrane anchor protein [Wigglesworthia glossinidia]
MVKKRSSLGLPGIYEWLLLRISGLLIFLYILCISTFIVYHAPINYINWSYFFSKKIIKIFTIVTIFSIAIHGWIGIWQVITDYVKPLFIRIVIQVIVFFILMSYILYSFKIIF